MTCFYYERFPHFVRRDQDPLYSAWVSQWIWLLGPIVLIAVVCLVSSSRCAHSKITFGAGNRDLIEISEAISINRFRCHHQERHEGCLC
jgi:hypothetical protein